MDYTDKTIVDANIQNKSETFGDGSKCLTFVFTKNMKKSLFFSEKYLHIFGNYGKILTT